MVKQPVLKRKQPRSQGMVEFALVMPILLLVVYGLLEVGRAILTDTIVISAAREGVRYGSTTGTVNVGGTEIPQYRYCQGIIDAVKAVDILGMIDENDISIWYDTGPGTASLGDCAHFTQTQVNGDRINVQVSAIFTPLVGLVPLTPHTFTSTNSRTLLGTLSVAGPGGTGGSSSGEPTLTVIVIGEGQVNGIGIHCPTGCVNTYPYGTEVILTQTADTQPDGSPYDFLGWNSAECGGVATTCTVTVDGYKTVKAIFESNPVLTINKTGVGSVQVNGVTVCDDACASYTQEYTIGTNLVLHAIPPSGITFDGWSGDCAGAGDCSIMISTAKTVTANFHNPSATTQVLTLKFVGLGTGTVSADGVTCTSSCSLNITSNPAHNVHLIATPTAPSVFISMIYIDPVTNLPAECVGPSPCDIFMDKPKTVTVWFESPYKMLQVTRSGGGTGTVTSNPAGILCSPTCAFSFNTKSTVVLTANPSAGSTFTGWSGACSGTGTCSVYMDTVKKVNANFDIPGQTTLTVMKTGSGTGRVDSDVHGIHGGISCGTICSDAFTPVSPATYPTVVLTALANTNNEFDHWTGCDSVDGYTCTVSLTAAKTVTATFNATPLPPCTMVVFNPPTWQNSAKTVTWNFSNTYAGTEEGTPPEIDHIIVFWDGGNLTSIVLDDSHTLWTGTQTPTTMSVDGAGNRAAYGAHHLVFSYPAPTTIKGYNFNATIYFKPTNCPIISTGSWTVQ